MQRALNGADNIETGRASRAEGERMSVIYNAAQLSNTLKKRAVASRAGELRLTTELIPGRATPFTTSVQRIPSLDGVRAISITLVVLSHLVQWKHVSLQVLGGYGALGVHVFFVLSGYLITNLLLREQERTANISLRDFYIRRAYRIFPAAFAFLAIVIVLYWQQMRWYHAAAAVLYVANMDLARPWIFGHLWSLSIEEQFYLVWPLALKKWQRHKTVILFCVLGATPVFWTILYALRVRNGLLGSLPAYADQLAIGCLLAIFAPRIPKIRSWLAVLMLVAVFFITMYSASSAWRSIFRLFVLAPLLNVCLAGLVLHVIQVPYWVLNWPPVAWLGRISYSLYLWQELFCSNASLHQGYFLLVPSLACACLSYYCVEQPMLRLREKRAGTRPHEPRPASLVARGPALDTTEA
jgi:peptidoglycan/LPS O-acetylase OafA/YrhL